MIQIPPKPNHSSENALAGGEGIRSNTKPRSKVKDKKVGKVEKSRKCYRNRERKKEAIYAPNFCDAENREKKINKNKNKKKLLWKHRKRSTRNKKGLQSHTHPLQNKSKCSRRSITDTHTHTHLPAAMR